MDPGTLIALLGMVLGCVVFMLAVYGVWTHGRLRGQRESREARDGGLQSPALETVIEARLARIERLAEGTSEEIERIAEAQRYSAMLLVSRADPNALPHGREESAR